MAADVVRADLLDPPDCVHWAGTMDGRWIWGQCIHLRWMICCCGDATEEEEPPEFEEDSVSGKVQMG